MTMRFATLLLTHISTVLTSVAGQTILWSSRDISGCRIVSPTSSIPFSVTGQVTYVRKDNCGRAQGIAISDPYGYQAFSISETCADAQKLVPGDIAVLSGTIRHHSATHNDTRIHNCTFLRHESEPEPVDASIADILCGRFNFRLVRTFGVLRDAVASESHREWIILVVCNGKDRIFVSVPTITALKALDHLVGRHISIVGICLPNDYSPRRWFGPTLKVASAECIRTCGEDRLCDKAFPDIEDITCSSPDELHSLGRHQAIGTVVATWGGRSAIIKTATSYVGLEFSSDPLPTYGQTIKANGLPETDLYRINLSHVNYEVLTTDKIPEDPPRDVSLPEIISANASGLHVNNRYFGCRIRMKGKIINLPKDGCAKILHLENEGHVFSADATSCPSIFDMLDIGYAVELTGICILESTNLHHPSRFPRLQDFILVLRSPKDIHILSRPSWWTPIRLVIAVGILLLALSAILVWNATLRIAVIRKSRALLKEQVSKIEETLKVDERTRLAAELHDYLAQNLTVVSYQISAAQNALQENRMVASQFIENADKMLLSSRTELRRCLWDLKSDALDDPDFAKAILKTVTLVANDAKVFVRFDIRRTRLNDSTAHAILSICRELVSNAVQHGRAKTVRIAGELKDDTIRFSVRDDGCGFDPTKRQGPRQGHFGLSGIIERIKRLDGKLEIHSSPGSGTRIIIIVHNRDDK